MEIKTSDLFDITSILQLKTERLKNLNDSEKMSYMAEYEMYRNEVEKACNMYPELKDLYKYLYLINGWIWTLEADLRQGVLDENDLYTLREIGETTIKVRDNNKLRIYLKNQITEIVKDSGIKEIKGDHRSE